MKPVPRVLDAYSLIAYLEGEDGKNTVIEVFKQARDTGQEALLCLVNWGEVYYITLREAGRTQAEHVADLLSTLPIKLVPVDIGLAKKAAEFKATNKMSFADCFAAALASREKAELVTGDHEFKQIKDSVKILWIE